MDIDKLFETTVPGDFTDIFDSVGRVSSEAKAMQQKKIAENVQLVVNALKKIESDISSRYDSVGNALEKRIITIKDGRDGADGSDGRNGRDGKNGRDGAPGPRGADGKNGLDGADGTDGVSVTNAHIDFDGSLVISLSSGQELNVGEVVAPALAEQIKVITNGGGTSQSVLDTLTSLQAQITAISGASIYKGLWNASTNTPTLASGVGTSGNFYIVSVAGSTNLDGITNWGIGDWAIYNGTAWQRVEGGAAGNFTTVTASSLTSGRVTYAGTAGLLQDSANLTFSGSALAVTGTLSATGLISAPAGVEIGSTAIANQTVKLWRGTAGEYGTVGVTGNGLNLNAQQGYVNLQLAGVDKVVLSSTGLAVTVTLTSTLDATHYGVTVGRGAGAVSTNTAVGASALAANAAGDTSAAFGYQALTTNTSGYQNTASGYRALRLNLSGINNSSFGFNALQTNSTSNSNSAFGASCLSANTAASNSGFGSACLLTNSTGVSNCGFGFSALNLNVSGSYNVAVGASALEANLASNNTAVGYQAGYTNQTGTQNTFVGVSSGKLNLSGNNNVVLGYFGLYTNSTGSDNVSIGSSTLSNGSATSQSVAVGSGALNGVASITNSVGVGYLAGNVATGAGNQFFGYSSGSAVTSGAKNVILGSYTGSAAPISATGSNYVVLSDGDGIVRGYFDSSGIYYVLGTNGQVLCGTTTSSGNFSNSTGSAGIAFYGATHATVPNKVVVTPGTNGVYMNSGATAWTAVSDERFKDIIEPISDAVTKVSSLRAVIGKFKTDEKNVRRSFLIAQDVQAVLPEAIDATNPDQLGVAYTDVIPLLVAAIKELSAKVTALENK